jgi:hypothetical protein
MLDSAAVGAAAVGFSASVLAGTTPLWITGPTEPRHPRPAPPGVPGEGAPRCHRFRHRRRHRGSGRRTVAPPRDRRRRQGASRCRGRSAPSHAGGFGSGARHRGDDHTHAHPDRGAAPVRGSRRVTRGRVRRQARRRGRRPAAHVAAAAVLVATGPAVSSIFGCAGTLRVPAASAAEGPARRSRRRRCGSMRSASSCLLLSAARPDAASPTLAHAARGRHRRNDQTPVPPVGRSPYQPVS